jgi:hypothetical protein
MLDLFTGINRSHFSNLDYVYVFTDDVEIIEFVERANTTGRQGQNLLRNNAKMPTIQPQPKVPC